MDPSDHDSNRTADDEHDVQPSDLEELAAVDFFVISGRLVSWIYSSHYSIHGMK